MKALIIGCGKIGAFYDSVRSEQILSHAHAYKKNINIQKIGFVDSDYNLAIKAAEEWEGVCFESISEAIANLKPDIVSICTPTFTHGLALKQVIELGVKTIICEKPLTMSSQESGMITALCLKNNVNLIVNYSRRFDSYVQGLKCSIDSYEYGEIVSVTSLYSKGIRNNGSHVINLGQFLFGDVLTTRALLERVDYDVLDPCIDAMLTFERCPSFHLVSCNENNFSIFEMDIIFTKGRLKFVDFGLTVYLQRVVEDKLFKGYRKLGETQILNTDLLNSMPNLIEHVINLNKKESFSAGKSAAQTDYIVEQLMKAIKDGK
ncbi:MAG: Gfo/Idh/MocA family oxidoreductase [Bacteriovorax sp.]|nr:Gfo/Idh/MocA family oxidoreductase [Bacteriovorax sp.]